VTDVWTFAAQTTMVGMGVVFVALFLLSVYMHFFKELTARIEGRSRKPEKTPGPSAPAPRVAPVPDEAPAPGDDEGARTAAAVAVALALKGVAAGPPAEVAAAIAAALALHRSSVAPSAPPAGPAAVRSWGLAGRLEAMAGRTARQERIHR